VAELEKELTEQEKEKDEDESDADMQRVLKVLVYSV
jgi:hypothetical protein